MKTACTFQVCLLIDMPRLLEVVRTNLLIQEFPFPALFDIRAASTKTLGLRTNQLPF